MRGRAPFLDRLLRQGEAPTPPDAPAGLERQALERGAPYTPLAPELARRALSVYDSRPIGARELIATPSSGGGVTTADNTTRYTASDVVVPQGRVLMLRGVRYTLDPLPAHSGAVGLRIDGYSLSLFRNGEKEPGLSDMIWAPWSGELELHMVLNELERLTVEVLYGSLEPGIVTPRLFTVLRGQLLIATGEPPAQLVGHLR